MSFPDTRLSLIRRLATASSDEDWQQFLSDYWAPICRFAARWGSLSPADAEDVASKTLEVLVSCDLLHEWSLEPHSKLRTLLCGVAKNIIANQARVDSGRRRLMRQLAEEGRSRQDEITQSGSLEHADVFYEEWAVELLQQSLHALMLASHRTGSGDAFRALYGRLCEGMTLKEIAAALDTSTSTVDRHVRRATEQLSEELKAKLREHIEQYTSLADVESEFREEWDLLSNYLRTSGGLGQVVRQRFHEQFPAP